MSPRLGSRLKEIGARNAALVESVLAVRRDSVFVDASKDPARVRLLREYAGLNPLVIHLTRDAPAFVASFTKNGKEHRFLTAIKWWNRTAWQLKALQRTMAPNHWLHVRYEDFCADPTTELNRILNFLGVPPAAPKLDFRRTDHHIIGNTMRLGASSDIKLDQKWRSALSAVQLRQVLHMTEKHRRLLGYVDQRALT
jgi:hypothetical protein